MSLKSIIIARVSTEEQKEANNSLPAQIAPLCSLVCLSLRSFSEG